MKRYLLFDSHCSLCITLARNIEQESDSWLMARSLHDVEMQAILNRTHPHWKFEPTLVEIENNKTRVYTGISMRMKIVSGVGPLRAWRISEIVRQAFISKDSENLSRRKFLRQTGALLTGLTLIGGAVTPRAQATRTAATIPCTDGEEYAGFLLLSEGTPLPACVNEEGLGIPNMCGVSDDSKERSSKIETIHIPLAGVSDLAARKVFSPFTIDPVPTGLVPSGATLIQRNTGEFWGG